MFVIPPDISMPSLLAEPDRKGQLLHISKVANEKNQGYEKRRPSGYHQEKQDEHDSNCTLTIRIYLQQC